MKRIILIGETGSGKTTISQWIHGQEQNYYKTQQVRHLERTIDTPGEFMENPFYYNALVSSSVDAEVIGLVQSINRSQNYFPPCFASRFTRPVIGIVSKVDLSTSEEDIEKAKSWLQLAGANKIFCVSAYDNLGLRDLGNYLIKDK